MKSNVKTALIVTSCIVFTVALFVFLINLAPGLAQNPGGPAPRTAYGERIDLIRIEGEIGPGGSALYGASPYNHEWLMGELRYLTDDPASRALVLYIDSPGGSVYETDEIYLQLLAYKKEGRPVYVSLGATAASGGYYIAAAGDKIVANRNTITGSIGVTYGTMLDVSGFLEQYGIKTNTITSGANKAMGSSFEALTEEQRAIFQSVIDESYEQFIDIVAKSRGYTDAKVREISDGRIYTAKQALAAGLIDTIGSLEDTVGMLRNDQYLGDLPVSESIAPVVTDIWSSLLGALPHAAPKNEAETVLGALQAYLNKGGYYCPYTMR